MIFRSERVHVEKSDNKKSILLENTTILKIKKMEKYDYHLLEGYLLDDFCSQV